MRRLIYVASLFLMATWPCGEGTLHAQWHQFRGPNGQGHSQSRQLPTTWSEAEHVVWKVPIDGLGHSSPVLIGNQIWLTTALNAGRSLRAVCVDAEEGRVLINQEVFAPAEPTNIDNRNSYATPTPVVEAARVYVHFGSAGTACLSAANGEVLWRNEEVKVDYLSGPANSPILFHGRLIVHFDAADQQFVAAFDTQTGRLVWKTNRSAPYQDDPILKRAFATPVLITVNGRPQLICLGADQMQAYDPDDGAEIWQVRYAGTSNIPMPLVGNDMVYVSTGFRKPELWAIRADGRGDVTNSHVVWRFTRHVPAVVSPILVGKRIYMVTELGVAACLDAETGRLVWQERIAGNFSASLVYGDGHIYLSSEEGKVTVIEPADEFRLLATNELDGQIKATPALADGAIFIRTTTHLYRIGAK
jgi:outer membrane protein assembly factor BamB